MPLYRRKYGNENNCKKLITITNTTVNYRGSGRALPMEPVRQIRKCGPQMKIAFDSGVSCVDTKLNYIFGFVDIQMSKVWQLVK